MHEHFEDVSVGDTREFGSYEVSAEEIVEFAERYDPQPFHTDPEAARESMFGELVASGWHTASMCMRMLVDNYMNDSGAQGATGVDELRWRRPVRPGDTLSVRTEVLSTEPWVGAPGYGVVESETVVENQDDEEVLSMVARVLFERRETE